MSKKKPQYKIIKPRGYRKPKLPGGKDWVKALESGKYRRGAGALHEGRNYCCLGVLCKVQGRLECHDEGTFTDAGSSHSQIGVLSKSNPCFEQLNGVGDLPKGVHVSIGDDIPFLSLAELNDSNRVGFKTIAKIIRSIWSIQ